MIEGAIVDKNARIGRGVKILNEAGETEKDGSGYFIREGMSSPSGGPKARSASKTQRALSGAGSVQTSRSFVKRGWAWKATAYPPTSR